jgi:hypothetical protein
MVGISLKLSIVLLAFDMIASSPSGALRWTHIVSIKPSIVGTSGCKTLLNEVVFSCQRVKNK